jgi:hypothetical protein
MELGLALDPIGKVHMEEIVGFEVIGGDRVGVDEPGSRSVAKAAGRR